MMWQPIKNSSISLQRQIIHWITDQIQSGDWGVGTKLPTQRQLALQFNVNRSTIQQALEELKADGILNSTVGSGVFVANNSWNLLAKKTQPNWQKYIEESIHKPNYHTIQLINEYEQVDSVVRLGTGELSPTLLPVKKLQESLRHLSFEDKDFGYSSPQGSLKLRQALSYYLKKRGITTSPENILIVSGALQALQLMAVGLFETGSVVFQDHSSYLNSIHPFQSFGIQMKSVKRDEHLEQTLQTKKKNRQSIYYTVPTLNNPTGNVWTLDEKENLYNTCKELQIPIIEDDVYSELLFESPIPSIKSLDSSGQVLYIGSISKTLSPGLRIGWVVGPTPVINRLADIKMQMDYGSSAVSQELVTYWLTSGLYENNLIELKDHLMSRAKFVENILTEQFNSIAKWESSRGGFYIWLRFNDPIVTKEFFLKLLKRKVLINPGYIYDSEDANHIRLSYSYASLEDLKRGLIILYEESLSTIKNSCTP
ncbi:PLP-dependent aminotransferase family protein [Rummeliibacillus pycnus]|uniref:aminotransferase-like domain-containing protein n=1 Tax=Rummeliibacillus pycnus TaxID=101070 RepID=UPI003D29D3FC